eukprot:bmy_08820T0
MSGKERFYGVWMQREGVIPNRKNESWRVTQGQRSNHRELSFNPTVTRRAHTREPGTKAATALGILRPPGAMVQQPLGAGENQGPPPSRVKRPLWQQHGCRKSARAWGINPKEHPVKQELERIRVYMNRVKEITDKKKAGKLDRGAASRFVKNALWEPKLKNASKLPIKEKMGNEVV